MFVKICGITSPGDAAVAVEAGADAIGVVLSASARRVDPGAVREIMSVVPASVRGLGVFRDADPREVVEIVRAAGLAGAQLHGDESPEEVAWIAARVECVVKAVTPRDGHRWPAAWALLVDGARPGSGERYHWGELPVPLAPRTILAGGLTPGNVGDAIARFRPFGVDVSTGVERSPGVKDPALVQAFVRAARQALEARRDDGRDRRHEGER